jgi:hypothetical protein
VCFKTLHHLRRQNIANAGLLRLFEHQRYVGGLNADSRRLADWPVEIVHPDLLLAQRQRGHGIRGCCAATDTFSIVLC